MSDEPVYTRQQVDAAFSRAQDLAGDLDWGPGDGDGAYEDCFNVVWAAFSLVLESPEKPRTLDDVLNENWGDSDWDEEDEWGSPEYESAAEWVRGWH